RTAEWAAQTRMLNFGPCEMVQQRGIGCMVFDHRRNRGSIRLVVILETAASSIDMLMFRCGYGKIKPHLSFEGGVLKLGLVAAAVTTRPPFSSGYRLAPEPCRPWRRSPR